MVPIHRPTGRGVLGAVVVFLAASLLGCSYLPHPRWPWARPAPPPEAVHELDITWSDGSNAPLPQYWSGNALIVALQAAGPRGRIVMRPREHTEWPVRIGFRVTPGEFEALDVRAQQRAVLPITPAGARPVDVELDPGVYLMKTPLIVVAWGPEIGAESH